MKIRFLKNKKVLSAFILAELFCLIILVFISIYLLKMQDWGHDDLININQLRYRSYLLADQLRQSSDDLTRMVRSYTVTGDSKFENYFWDIVDIREGKKPRPINYNRVYWDFMTAKNPIPPFVDGDNASLEWLMKEAGFTEKEFQVLADAKNKSDKLISLERIAMNAMKGKLQDEKGEFSIIGEPDPEMAKQIVFGEEYHEAKKNIMGPINEFLKSIDQRNSQNIAQSDSRVRFYHLTLEFVFGGLILNGILLLLTTRAHQKLLIGQFKRANEMQALELAERKQAERALKESERLYHSLVDAMNEGMAMIDEDGQFNFANKQFCKILGYPMSEIMEAHWTALYDEGAQKVILEQLEKREEGSSESYELENTRKDGKKIWISISPKPVYDEGGNVKGSMGLVQDITERKVTEEQIKASLNEKELLLREIHHRVKNNMQVISSLLRLQADRIDDKGYAVMLKESQLRIQSMSLIHEKLYLSNDFANIDFKGYVKTLANTLIKSHGVDYDKISLCMEIEDVSLDIENAIPCGLIINELLSNSLKYAFPEEREGEISICLRSISEGMLELVVADNGIGLPEDLDIRNTNTLGLYLVTMLAERQLDGEVEMKRAVGMECSIMFNKQDYKPRI